MSVSISPPRGADVVSILMPPAPLTSPALAETIRTSYRASCNSEARLNAQGGPLRSSSSKPGKTTNQIEREDGFEHGITITPCGRNHGIYVVYDINANGYQQGLS